MEITDDYYFKEAKNMDEIACLSEEWHDILKNVLDYDGIVITPPFYKEKFNKFDKKILVENSLKVGNDLTVLPGRIKDLPEIFDYFRLKYKKGDFSLEKKKSGVYKIERLLKKEGFNYSLSLKKEDKVLIESVIKDGIKILKGKDEVKKSFLAKKLLVLVPKTEDNFIVSSLKYYRRNFDFIEYDVLKDDNEFIKNVKEKCKNYDATVLFSENAHINLFLENLTVGISREAKVSTVVGLGNPYEFYFINDIVSYVFLGNNHKRAVKVLFEVIYS
jgi:beta-glucosidase-like glycosyl hydrolase